MREIEVEWSDFYDYTNNLIIENVPNTSGIYFLWTKRKNESGAVFFAGGAENIRSRLLFHNSIHEHNHCITAYLQDELCGFEYALIDDENDRNGICKYLSNNFNIECNLSPITDLEEISVNLPFAVDKN